MKKQFLFLFFTAIFYANICVGVMLKEMLADYHPVAEKRIVIVITSYNNKDWYEPNLMSIFQQKYQNYRIIYIDDHSSDHTTMFVKELVSKMNQWHRFTIVENQEWESQMANHYKAVQMCDDDEIVVHMDGDDWLAQDTVLELINKVYSKWDVWITYGQFVSWPQGEVGCSREVPEQLIANNSFREFGFYYSHPRTFYAWLFKKIKLKDLIFKGSFIPAAPTPDVLLMFPMLEMAGTHSKFIPDILYCWNRKNSLSQHNLPVKKEMPPAQNWQKYQPLDPKDIHCHKKQNTLTCNLIILNDDGKAVRDFVNQELSKIKGISKCAIVGITSEDCQENIRYFGLGNKNQLSDYVTSNNPDYVLIITDVNTLAKAKDLDIAECMQALNTTGALAFFFGLDKSHFIRCNEPIPYAPFTGAVLEYRCTPLSKGMIAWQFDCESYLFNDAKLISMLMLKAGDSLNQMCNIMANFNKNMFVYYVQGSLKKDREIGLMYEYSKL